MSMVGKEYTVLHLHGVMDCFIEVNARFVYKVFIISVLNICVKIRTVKGYVGTVIIKKKLVKKHS